jgi:hypothetical protein
MAVNNLNKVKIPGTGTTAARPSNPAVGDTYYNGTLGYQEIYTVNGWFALGAPASIPTSVVATDQGSGRAYNNGQASVAFSVGTEAGATPSYVVTSSPGSYTATGSSSPILVTGLQSSTQYTYTIVGKSPYGASNASTASAGVTATTVPQAPTIDSTVAASAQARIFFTANNTGGSAITSFTATSSPGNFTATGSSSPLTVTGLTNGTSYTFTVTATNANGTSLASSASSSTTPGPDVAPSTVELLVVAGGGGANTESTYQSSGGGGGAGGYRYFADQSVAGSTNYTVTVGGGGASPSGKGSNSVFGSRSSTGGGGAGGPNYNAGNGGSGGGARSIENNRTPGSGNEGGYTPSEGNGGSADGGGGGSGSGGSGSSGGSGTSNAITGTSVTRAKGGNGGSAAENSPGAANTGDGGNGGARFGGTTAIGGSGVVILAYDSFGKKTLTVGGGLTYTLDTSSRSGYNVYRFTAGTGTVSWT